MTSTMAEPRVAVIGAGVAGLCALKHMACNHPNKFNPICFETKSRAGGVWLYSSDPNQSYSAVYDNMKITIPKEIMELDGFPFSDDLPPASYLHHSDFFKYLESFIHHYKLEQYIQFNTEVTKVSPNPRPSCLGTAWDIITKNVQTGQESTSTWDAVLVCNGHCTLPYQDIRGMDNFKGMIMHSQKYRNPRPFKSQRVLVVGGGYSGTDIAFEIATTAEHVYYSQRRRGLSSEDTIPKNFILVPKTSCIDKNGSILLDNGNRLLVDSVVLCTGYQYDFPFLSEDCRVRVSSHRVQPLYKHIFNIHNPSMAFIGLNLRTLQLLIFDTQMKLVCAVYSGLVILPDKDAMMEDEEHDFQERLRSSLLPKDAHVLGGNTWQYCKNLAEIGRFDCHDLLIHEKVNAHVASMRKNEVATYRNYNYVIVDKEKGLFDFYTCTSMIKEECTDFK